jgi:hypothetical protein
MINRTASPATPQGEFAIAMVERFVGDRCVREAPWFETAADLWSAYLAWCEQSRVKAVKQTAFGRAMAALGFAKHRGHIVTYRGVRLRG